MYFHQEPLMITYREHPALNHSKLKYLDEKKYVPEDFHARFIAKTIIDEPSAAMEFGKLFHMYALQPDLVHEKVAIELEIPEFGDCRKKVNKEAKQKWIEEVLEPWQKENADKIIIDNKAHLQLNEMVNKLHNIKSWKHLNDLPRGKTFLEFERDVYFKYNEVECKAQWDIIIGRDKIIYDLKTVDNVNKGLFTGSTEKYSYDTQAAFYIKAACAEYGSKFEDWEYVLVACCKQAPYHVRFFKLPMAYLLRAKRKNEKRLELYKQCMLWNDWAGYSEEVEELEIPRWNMEE